MKYSKARQTLDCRVLLTRNEVRSLGMRISDTTLLRWEIDGKFPKRVRLGSTTVAWDRAEIMNWIEERKSERATYHYADPRD